MTNHTPMKNFIILKRPDDKGVHDLNAQGFTLLEVLVASTVFSMMIFLAIFSYSQILNSWKKWKSADQSALDEFRVQTLVRNSLESITDYYVTDTTNEPRRVFYPYFKGTEQEILFVTQTSVFTRGLPAVASIRLDVKNEQSATLIYEEFPLDGDYVKYNDFVPEFAHKLVMRREVNSLFLRFFGFWKEEFVVQSDTFQPYNKWHTEFLGQDRRAVPLEIELTVQSEDHGTEVFIYQVMAQNPYKRDYFAPEI